MIVTILIKKIISLFLIMLMGVGLIRFKLLKQEESKPMSMVALYLIVPCTIINAFQVEITPDIVQGIKLSLASAVMIHVLLLLLNFPIRKLFHLDVIEQVSVIYSNSGNLIIPLVVAMFGQDMVIYTASFLSVQLILFWTHCKSAICREKGIDLKKILTNINMIAVMVGIFCLIAGIKITGPLQDAIASVGSMIGPLCMLVTGMLIGSMDLRATIRKGRLWLVCFLRLILVPLLILLIMKLLGLEKLAENGSEILLISFMACITPSASTIVQMAQVYGQDAQYASAINVLSTLLAIVTMPVMVYFFTVL